LRSAFEEQSVQQGDISVQLYSVRQNIARDLPGTLRRLAEIGYRNVEPFGMPDRVEEYEAVLADLGLRAPSAHVRLVTAERPAEQLDALAGLGVRTVIEPAIPEDRWTSKDAIEASAERLNQIAEQAASRGLAVGYHNHWWELESSVDGRPALEVFADLLDPRVVLEVDVYWAEVGGVAAAGLLRRLGDRVGLIHVKDGPVTRDNIEQRPAGDGAMPMPEILAAAAGATRVVEFDDYGGDIYDGLAASLAYLVEHE
jgi:sugar phosphate isomerase/epimerase